MNIVIINWQDWKNPYSGGAEVYLYEIFSRLAKRGHKIILLVSRAKDQSRFEVVDGFEVFRIGKRANFNFLVPHALRAILRHKEVDLIIDDLNKIPFYSPLFVRKKTVPMLMHLFLRTIYQETNFFIASYVYFMERIITFLYPSSNFVAISCSTATDLRSIGVKNTIHVVNCGIPVVLKTEVEKRQKNLIAYVGRLKRYTSIDHFVKAVAHIKRKRNIEVVIVGDGDAQTELMALSKKIGVDIKFTGFVSEDEKNQIYARARLVVQPSVKEGWGLTAIEAQSYGTPVVCADSPGLREVVDNGKTGYLYPYGDINSLVGRIIELLDDDRKWQKFSLAAAKWAKRFSWDNAADELEKILMYEIKDN